MYDEPDRIGIEISRNKNESWESLIVRYATPRNLTIPVMNLYKELTDKGMDESIAALRSLAEFSCTDIIINKHHVRAGSIVVN